MPALPVDRLLPWAVGVAAAVILVLRHPWAFLRPEPWADEAAWYSDALARGIATIAEPWSGYLLVGPRLVAVAETLVTPRWAPLLGVLVAAAVTAGVAALIASDRLALLIPDRRRRMVLAIGFVLLPATSLVFVSVSHLQWPLTVYLLVMAGTTAAASRVGQVADGLGMTVAGLSGPGGFILLPLFVARWFWRRDLHAVLMLGTVSVTAAIQVYVMTWASRLSSPELDLSSLPQVIALRGVIEPLIGTNAALRLVQMSDLVWWIVAIVLVTLGIFASRRRLVIVPIAFVALSIMVLGIIHSEHNVAGLLDPFPGQRYFLIAGLAWLAVIGFGLPRRSAVVLGLVMILGVTGDFLSFAPDDFHWASESACIGGPEPCRVTVAPGEPWAVEWTP